MRSYSLKATLVLCCLGICAVPLIFMGGYFYYKQKSSLYLAQEQKLQLAIDFSVNLVNQKISQFKRPIRAINNQPITPKANNNSSEATVNRVMSLYKVFSGIAIYSAEGKLIFSKGNTSQISDKDISMAASLLPNDVVCAPLSDSQRHYMLICRNHNKRITVAVLKNHFFSEAMLQSRFGKTGEVIITDAENRIIFHPINSMRNKTLPKISSEVKDGEIFTYLDPIKNTKNIGVRKIIGSSEISGQGLKAIAYMKYTEAFAGVEDFKLTLIAYTAGALAFVALASALASTLLTRTMYELARMGMQLIHGKDPGRDGQHFAFRETEYLRKVLSHVSGELQRMRSFRRNFKKEITLRNKFEKKLLFEKTAAEDASKAKDEFIANVSHEIRTPLNAVIGFSEKAMLNTHDTTLLSDLKTINNEAEHLLLLINDLLDNAKIEAGKLDLEYIPFDLYQHLSTISAPFREQAKNKNLQFELDITDAVPQYIILDQLRLRQILSNLLSNAIKFTNSGKITLRVETQTKDQHYATTRFMVTDTGIGIPKEKQKLIFEKFTQADGSTTRQYGGTGLGTTISKKLVTLMGGRMDVRSVVGQGSTFWFDLVLDINIPPEQVDTLKVEAIEQKKNFHNTFMGSILVAEDYNINQILIRSQLEYLGLSVEIAGNGKAAINECQNMLYDLIFMDLQMPQMSGVEATRFIRMELPEYKNVPILALTANADKDVRNTCRSVGIDDVLTKPTHIDEIATALYKWCPQLVKNSDNLLGIKTSTDDNQTADEVFSDSSGSYELEPLPETLNLSEGLSLFGGNKMVFEMSINAFRDSVTSQLLPELKGDIAASDLETAGKTAHKIRGGAASIAAHEMTEAAAALEEAAKNNRQEAIQSLLVTLEEKFKELTIFISNL